MGGTNVLPLQVQVLFRFFFTSPLDPTDSGLSPQPPLSCMAGDPQAILSPSSEDSCPLTLLPLWDTSRELTRQTWHCEAGVNCGPKRSLLGREPRECLEGKEFPIPPGSQSTWADSMGIIGKSERDKDSKSELDHSHRDNDGKHLRGALYGSGIF